MFLTFLVLHLLTLVQNLVATFQLTRSSDGKVVLRNVTEFASGVYKCEITAVGTFRTLAKELLIIISGMDEIIILAHLAICY